MDLQILKNTKFIQIHMHAGVYTEVALILPLTKPDIFASFVRIHISKTTYKQKDIMNIHTHNIQNIS